VYPVLAAAWAPVQPPQTNKGSCCHRNPGVEQTEGSRPSSNRYILPETEEPINRNTDLLFGGLPHWIAWDNSR